MKGRLIFAISIAASLTSLAAMAQVENVKQVATDDATSRTNNNISSGVDNGLGKAEGTIKGLFGKKKKKADAANQNNNTATTNNNAPQNTGNITAYNNYDFVPGDQIVFDDNFADDQNGEFPTHWNLGKGQAVVNAIGGRPAFLLTDGNYAHVSPLIKSASYLGDAFTIEFDDYSSGGYHPRIYFYNSTADATAATNDQASVSLGSDAISIGNKNTGLDLTGSLPTAINGENYLNKWHHIAIAYRNNQVKVYVDQYRVLVAPNLGTKPHAFDIEGIGDINTPIIISNVRVANGGGMNMLNKKFTDAKIVTHGINFDIDQARIRPESMGTLNQIKLVLTQNPELKFEIDGHTDNSGTSLHNLTLSQARADAVKAQLISMGIDASRLTTKGLGDVKPMSDNSTPEGKANNRRVEFVKI